MTTGEWQEPGELSYPGVPPPDHGAIERLRWGGPSPWAGRDSRTDAQKRADAIEIRLEWHTGNPPKPGYYLAAWRNPGQNRWQVSELWFNDSTGWFTGRGYLGQEHTISPEPLDVAAWAPMPTYVPPGEGS